MFAKTPFFKIRKYENTLPGTWCCVKYRIRDCSSLHSMLQLGVIWFSGSCRYSSSPMSKNNKIISNYEYMIYILMRQPG